MARGMRVCARTRALFPRARAAEAEAANQLCWPCAAPAGGCVAHPGVQPMQRPTCAFTLCIRFHEAWSCRPDGHGHARAAASLHSVGELPAACRPVGTHLGLADGDGEVLVQRGLVNGEGLAVQDLILQHHHLRSGGEGGAAQQQMNPDWQPSGGSRQPPPARPLTCRAGNQSERAAATPAAPRGWTA